MKKRIALLEILFWLVVFFVFVATVNAQNAKGIGALDCYSCAATYRNLVATVEVQNEPPPPATFTFGPTTACSAIVLNDDPNLTGTICPYQGDPSGGYGSFLDVPYQLGFLNNGYLAGCDPMVWGQKTFAQRPDGTTGDGTQAGDTFTQPASTTCPYYTGEYGGAIPDNFLPQFSIVANFTVEKIISCGRYGCRSFLKTRLTGGTGVVEETVVQ